MQIIELHFVLRSDDLQVITTHSCQLIRTEDCALSIQEVSLNLNRSRIIAILHVIDA